MPQYFFHVSDGELILDNEGVSCLNYSEAKLEAVRLMGGLASENPEKFWSSETLKVLVTSETGALLLSLQLVAAEAPSTPPPVRLRPSF